MEIFTGHEAEMAIRKSEEFSKPTKQEMANYLIDNIKDVLTNNFKELFDAEESTEQKIYRIKSLITEYGF